MICHRIWNNKKIEILVLPVLIFKLELSFEDWFIVLIQNLCDLNNKTEFFRFEKERNHRRQYHSYC